jgi:hypothetical protein
MNRIRTLLFLYGLLACGAVHAMEEEPKKSRQQSIQELEDLFKKRRDDLMAKHKKEKEELHAKHAQQYREFVQRCQLKVAIVTKD